MYTILVTGSRHWNNVHAVEFELGALHQRWAGEMLVVHGDCPSGADQIADRVCHDLGIDRVKCPANWKANGKAGGPIRNRLMLSLFDVDLVLAFPLEGGRGTQDMIRAAKEAGVRVETVEDQG